MINKSVIESISGFQKLKIWETNRCVSSPLIVVLEREQRWLADGLPLCIYICHVRATWYFLLAFLWCWLWNENVFYREYIQMSMNMRAATGFVLLVYNVISRTVLPHSILCIVCIKMSNRGWCFFPSLSLFRSLAFSFAAAAIASSVCRSGHHFSSSGFVCASTFIAVICSFFFFFYFESHRAHIDLRAQSK